MSKIKKPSKKDILEAINRLEKNPNSRTKILGEIGVAGMGAAGAGALAAVFGAGIAPIPIITALTGVGMVVAAPVALVAGAAVAGGAAAYGLTKLATSGAYDQGKREEIKQKLQDRLKEIETEEQKSKLTEENKNSFIIFLKDPLELDLITAEQAQDLIELVENGKMSLEGAYNLLQETIGDIKNLPRKERTDSLRGQSVAMPNIEKSSEDSTQRKVLRLVDGDQDVAKRLVDQVQLRHPDKDEQWCWEKVLYDIHRDRGG